MKGEDNCVTVSVIFNINALQGLLTFHGGVGFAILKAFWAWISVMEQSLKMSQRYDISSFFLKW